MGQLKARHVHLSVLVCVCCLLACSLIHEMALADYLPFGGSESAEAACRKNLVAKQHMFKTSGLIHIRKASDARTVPAMFALTGVSLAWVSFNYYKLFRNDKS